MNVFHMDRYVELSVLVPTAIIVVNLNKRVLEVLIPERKWAANVPKVNVSRIIVSAFREGKAVVTNADAKIAGIVYE